MPCTAVKYVRVTSDFSNTEQCLDWSYIQMFRQGGNIRLVHKTMHFLYVALKKKVLLNPKI